MKPGDAHHISLCWHSVLLVFSLGSSGVPLCRIEGDLETRPSLGSSSEGAEEASRLKGNVFGLCAAPGGRSLPLLTQ